LAQVEKRYIDHHFFISFSLRECISKQNRKSLYLGKTGMRISGQVYYIKNCKKTDFTNLGYHIRGRNDEKLTRPENLYLNSRGGGDVEYAKTVSFFFDKIHF
jgi:hypothetical protein